MIKRSLEAFGEPIPSADKLLGHRDISKKRFAQIEEKLTALYREKNTLLQDKKRGYKKNLEAVAAQINELETTKERLYSARSEAQRNLHALSKEKEQLAKSGDVERLSSLEKQMGEYDFLLKHSENATRKKKKETPRVEEAREEKVEDVRASVVELYDQASTIKDEEGIEELLKNLPSEEEFVAMQTELKTAESAKQPGRIAQFWNRIRGRQSVPDQGRIDALRANVLAFTKLRAEADEKIAELEQKRAELESVAGEKDPEVVRLGDLVNALTTARVQGGKKVTSVPDELSEAA